MSVALWASKQATVPVDVLPGCRFPGLTEGEMFCTFPGCSSISATGYTAVIFCIHLLAVKCQVFTTR